MSFRDAAKLVRNEAKEGTHGIEALLAGGESLASPATGPWTQSTSSRIADAFDARADLARVRVVHGHLFGHSSSSWNWIASSVTGCMAPRGGRSE
jgi:hypothetical protein